MKTISLQRCLTGISALALCAALASCDDDDDPTPTPTPQPEPQATETVFTFEDVPADLLAGPTSYGDNLYSTFSGKQAKSCTLTAGAYTLTYSLNEAPQWDGSGTTAELYNGGAAASRWNIRSNIEGKQADWWQSYENQCSVYNTASTDGKNTGAGHDGSNTFLILHGNAGNCAKIAFGRACTVSRIWLCNSSYGYGVQENGNAFAASLKATGGFLRLKVYGYDKDDNATNDGQPVSFTLCDYAAGKNAIHEWTSLDLKKLGAVASLKFDFEGSDTGDYGLNTPADVCIDDITILN